MFRQIVWLLLLVSWRIILAQDCFGDYQISNASGRVVDSKPKQCWPVGYFTLGKGWHYLFRGDLAAVSQSIKFNTRDDAKYQVTVLLELPRRQSVRDLAVTFNGQELALDQVDDCERFNLIFKESYVLAAYNLTVNQPSEFSLSIKAKQTIRLKVRKIDLITLAKLE